MLTERIRLNERPVRPVLPLLLQDKTTRKNIIWATGSYASLGAQYAQESQMTTEALVGMDAILIQPRVLKAQEEQQERTRSHAEVFTPSWVCNQMNNFCDDEWFGRQDVFNRMDGQEWTSVEEPVRFPERKSWKRYVDSRRLEITCGEAPFIVSRYDAATGEALPIPRRIGLLDRKLRVVNENAADEAEWMEWTVRAFQSVYGYEFQGDNLLLARVNLLMTFTEYLDERWHRPPGLRELKKIANIITWNFWQMDGLKGTVPLKEPEDLLTQISFDDLFGADLGFNTPAPTSGQAPLSRVKDWRKKNSLPFETIGKEKTGIMKFDFVIGNPPYQEETAQKETENGQKSLKNVFQHFQIAADGIISEKGSSVLIYPAIRWIHQAGKGLKEFGHDQINDPHLSNLMLYEDAHVLFPSALINDGISIVVKKKNKHIPGFKYTFISKKGEKINVNVDNPGDTLLTISPRDTAIAEKIDAYIKKNHLSYLHDAILPRSLFGIESDFVEKNPNLVKPFAEGTKVDFRKDIKLFTNDKARSSGRTKWFVVPRKVIKKNPDKIDEWQVTVISANAGGQRRDNQLMIIDNHSAFGRSRVALRSFKTLEEAQNFEKYISTVFVRYTFQLTNEALTSVGKRVPDFCDYTSKNIFLDFKKDLDTQLFDLFELTPVEIAYVRNIVDNIRKKENE